MSDIVTSDLGRDAWDASAGVGTGSIEALPDWEHLARGYDH